MEPTLQILSLALAAIIALVALPLADPTLAKLVLETAQFLGDLFMNALKMVVVP